MMTRLFNIILLLVAFLSGLLVVNIRHKIRMQHIELTKLQAESKLQQERYNILLLEFTRLSNYELIQKRASAFNLVQPTAQSTVQVIEFR